MKAIGYAFITLICATILFAVLNGTGLIGDATQVAHEEFGARPALEKYEWFKTAAKQLGAKRQDLNTYSTVLKSMENDYGSVPKADWPRDVRQEYSQRKSELAGLITAYNSLVAEYQTASAKFNWKYFEDKADRPPLSFENYSEQ